MATKLPTSGGATARLEDDAANGVAANMLDVPGPEVRLFHIGLFIDHNSMASGKPATVKYGHGGRPQWGSRRQLQSLQRGHGGHYSGGGGHGGHYSGGGGHGGSYNHHG